MSSKILRKITILSLVGIFLSIGITNTAAAQNYAKRTVLNFEGEDIDGALNRPDGDYLDAMKTRKYKNLIKIRKNFKVEILKSVRKL